MSTTATVLRDKCKEQRETFHDLPNAKMFSEFNWQPIDVALQTITSALNEYEHDEKAPLEERVKVYKDLSDTVKTMAGRINSSKTLYERFKSFFVYLSDDERKFGQFSRRDCMAAEAARTRS